MLQGQLDELAALLAMTNDEKQAYLADRDRRIQQEAQKQAHDRDAAEEASRDQQARQQHWRQRQNEANLQRQQHDRDAVVIVGDIKSMIAQGLYRQAVRYSRQAIMDFSDTSSAMELTDLRAVAEREMIRQGIAQKEADEEAQRQAAALEAHLQFSRRRQEGLAAYNRSDYRQAVGSFREALRFEDSDEVRNLLRQAQAKLQVDEDRAYTDAMDRAATAIRQGRWDDAMEAYQGALALRKTSQAQDGVAAAKAKLQQQAQYRQMLDAANDAIGKGDYKIAWKWTTAAAGLFPDAPEARELAGKLGPTLGVKASLDGKDYAGAQVTIDGKVQGQTTPASFRFKKGQAYKVVVTIPAKGGKTYSTDEMEFQADENGHKEFSANISQVKAPPLPQTAPVSKPEVPPLPKPHPTPTPATIPHAPAIIPDVAPTSKPVGIPTSKPAAVIANPKLPIETPADKANRKKYDLALDAAGDSIKNEDYPAAWEHIDAALAVDPTGEEAKALAEKLGPTLTVTAELNGKTCKGAMVTLTPPLLTRAKTQALVTPASLRLTKGQTYDVVVSLRPSEGKSYAPDHKSIKIDRNGSYEFHAVLKEVTEPASEPIVKPTSQPALKPIPTSESARPNPNNAKYQEAIQDAEAAIKKKDYKTAWQQIELALSIVPDGKEAGALAQTLGPTLTVVAMLNDTQYPGARVSLNGQLQKDTTPSAFKLKSGQTYKIEVTIVKRGKSYTTDTKTITPDKTGNTEFIAVIKEVK
jgi:adenosyl cobinamide kinase/adenosyl cobinamide phosphate guanylyltransferase